MKLMICSIRLAFFRRRAQRIGFDPAGFGNRPVGERKAKTEGLLVWLRNAAGEIEGTEWNENLESWPVTVEVKVWQPPEGPLDPEDAREVDLNVLDAEDALTEGNLRAACGRYFMAWRFSQHRRMDLALKWQELKQRFGPDNADESYKEIMERLIPIAPLNEDIWMAAAKSALASGGAIGRKRAKEALEMVLVLVPDHAEAKAMLAKLGE